MKKSFSVFALILTFLVFGKFPAFSENDPAEQEVFSVELFGQVLTSEQERIEFINTDIGEDGVEMIREVLPRLSACKYLLLDSCGISNETMAVLRDDFPDIKIVWRVGFEGFPLTFLTDSTVAHVAVEIGGKIIYDWNSSVLNYCTDVEYLDLGHGVLTNIDFCAYMPHLKYLIMSYNPISDLSPLKNCQELEFAEFYFCSQLRDISPLSECRNLKYLNISATGVDDISPVYGLDKLERFFCIMNDYHVTSEQKEEIFNYLPDCWITFEKPASINVGWSYDEPNVRADWYLKIRDIWRYLTELWYVGYVE
ncbi:MAG: hypothetical protein Q4F31_05455 [Eubacteriales bacterium]|nr:hypothetical protein [Eubacteriales bacterium]